jgi:divalent metal cation (Fe/Co/Zn/Cd) transporter
VKHGEYKMSDAIVYEGKKLAIMSSALNMVFTEVKFLLYLFTSATLLAEAIHSLTDVLGSILVAGGIYLSEKKSEQFPYGLYILPAETHETGS